MGIITDFLIDKAKDAAVSKAKDITVDKAKDMVIEKAEDIYMGEEDKAERAGCASNILRFFISLIWLIVVLGIDILSFIVFNPLVGAGLELCIFVITLCIPFLRKKGTLTRWWGWLALLSAISLLGIAFGR